MSTRRERLLATLQEKAPWLHTALTDEGKGYSTARSIVVMALILGLGVTLLWGLTGQPLGDTPVVVIESGSMMHCSGGVNLHGAACGSQSFGRIGTIEAGDLVFVRNVHDRGDVATFAQDGKERYGLPGDVIVYQNPFGGPPIIHRAMFWLDIHEDGTFSATSVDPSLSHVSLQEIHDAARDQGGYRMLSNCRLQVSATHGLGPASSGFVTKGDNNDCWDQGGGITNLPVHPDWIMGKARGEIPWIGLLKLWVFDLLAGRLGSGNYAAAPGDLKVFLWTSVAALIVVPYGAEWGIKRYRERRHDRPPPGGRSGP